MIHARLIALALLISVTTWRAQAEDSKEGEKDREPKADAAARPRPEIKAPPDIPPPHFFPNGSGPEFRVKMLKALAEIKPLPETPIPDDPPPHEGAMIDLPYIVDAPDLLLVEVLEALPGRPITGERLVRPDGTINLGFYGEVHVRGLTLNQIKVKITEHLRIYLPDSVLGLIEDTGEQEAGPVAPVPDLPRNVNPFDPLPPEKKPEPPAHPKTSATGAGRVLKRTSGRRIIRRVADESSKPAPAEAPTAAISLPAGSNITIKIEINAAKPPEPMERVVSPEDMKQPPQNLGEDPGSFKTREVAPEDSNRVFVDVTAFNSKFYYVTGDVQASGKYPTTGNETVFDALNYAGGFIATADPENIRLVRPARGGKPEKIYKIDYRGIVEKGDKRLNYQLFPGDRLIVGRNKLVQDTILLDRLGASLHTLVNSSLQVSNMYRTLVTATPDLTPAQRETLLKEWFELYWKTSTRPGGPAPDEKTMRELLLHQFKTLPKPESAPEKK